MTAIAPQMIPAPHRAGASQYPRHRQTTVAARRDAEAATRRREALARLANRRMPLPGQPFGNPADPRLSDHARRMYLVEEPDMDEDSSTSLPKPSLTAREVEVLRTWLMVDSKPAVAQELFISLGTVNTHLTRIRAKYSDIGRAAPTKAGLVARAVQDGIVDLDEL